jgi:hypothetical protein
MSFAGHRGFRPGFGGYPFYFADFGLGLALGLSFIDPWYYDGVYGGYYGNYAYGPPPPYYYPPAPYGQAGPPPPPATSAQPPAACGSWAWDTAKQVYNWVACAS